MVKLNDLLNITGICPILVEAAPDMTVPAARSLVKAGVPCMEILMRDTASLEHLSRAAENVPELIVGAGTVKSVEQAMEVIDRGAKFVVLPGFSTKIVEVCLKRNVQVIPGCVTAAELQLAYEYGLETVKFFPVYQMGGAATMDMLHVPYPSIRFLVTGSLNADNFLPLLESKSVIAAGGDWMFTDGNALADRNYDLITANTRNSHYRVLDMRAARDREQE